MRVMVRSTRVTQLCDSLGLITTKWTWVRYTWNRSGNDDGIKLQPWITHHCTDNIFDRPVPHHYPRIYLCEAPAAAATAADGVIVGGMAVDRAILVIAICLHPPEWSLANVAQLIAVLERRRRRRRKWRRHLFILMDTTNTLIILGFHIWINISTNNNKWSIAF